MIVMILSVYVLRRIHISIGLRTYNIIFEHYDIKVISRCSTIGDIINLNIDCRRTCFRINNYLPAYVTFRSLFYLLVSMCRPICSAQSVICRTIDDSLRKASDIKTIIYRRSVGSIKVWIIHWRIISRMNVNSPHPTRIRIHQVISYHVSIGTIRTINSCKFFYDNVSILRRSRDKLLRVKMQRHSNND